uniref:Polyprotein protein n=1 Tax=Solanum tuberosum TaxID=4113 RepID=M1DBK1_SOLTU
MDQLKSTDMSMIFGIMEIPDVSVEPHMPTATTRDDVRVEKATYPEYETNEEMLEIAEEVSYKGLTETEEAMADAAVQTSLADTPLADPNGRTTVDVTPGTDASTDRATV